MDDSKSTSSPDFSPEFQTRTSNYLLDKFTYPTKTSIISLGGDGVGGKKKKNLTIKTEQEKLYFTHTTVSHKCDIYHILYIYVKYSLDGPWFH